LITRAADKAKAKADGEDENEDEEEGQELEAPLLELDDEALAVITQQVLASEAWKPVQQAISDLQAVVKELQTVQENDKKEITRLADVNKKLVGRLQAIEKDDATKLDERVADLPAKSRQTVKIGHRPSTAYRDEVDGEALEDFAERAKETLSNLPRYN
jgi:hypothetical protein